jgi:hypothetical protein
VEDRLLVIESVARIRAWQGQDIDALVEEIEDIARETSDPQSRYSAAVVRADLGFARGDLRGSVAAYRRAATMSAGNAPNVHPQAARSGLLARDAVAAAADLDALEATGVHSPWIESRRVSIRAGLAALDGRPADALALYGAAIRGFRDLSMLLDEALTGMEMAVLLDLDEPEVRAAANAARDILVRLRAQPFLERLDSAMSPRPADVAVTPA